MLSKARMVNSLVLANGTGLTHSHSIVNSWSLLRGKARCVSAENGPDTDSSTVTFESPSQGSLLAISLIEDSLRRLECESGMFVAQ